MNTNLSVGEVLAAEQSRIAGMPEVPASEAAACALCGDSGFVVREVDGRRAASDCVCRRERVLRQRLERCGLPGKFAGARFDNYRTAGLDPSCGWALRLARGVAENFVVRAASGEPQQGLLLTGTCGVGKTHLACALLAEIVSRYGVSGRFWDIGELLLQVKRGFSGVNGGSEGMLFDDLRGVDVLVLDDLGAARPTEWSFDEVWLMIAARYNANRLTVLTTNYPNLGVGERGPGAMAAETLGDRVGARAFSRLQEMCRAVELVGADFRRKRA